MSELDPDHPLHGFTDDIEMDPYHDSLYSNPELAETYEQYLDEGMSKAEAWEQAKEDHGMTEGSDKSKAESFDYEEVDDALYDAFRKSVMWGVDENNPDLSKAPGIWTSDDQVPDYVLEKLREIIEEEDLIWDSYARLPPSAQRKIEDILEENLTQPQGWSLQSLVDDMEEEFPEADTEYLMEVARNETSAVLNNAREEAYEEREDSESYVYSWVGPVDHRTTDTCLSIAERIEDRGGAVPMDDLKEILLEEARAHSDAEGTPGRAEDFVPHWNCRRTMVRRVQSL